MGALALVVNRTLPTAGSDARLQGKQTADAAVASFSAFEQNGQVGQLEVPDGLNGSVLEPDRLTADTTHTRLVRLTYRLQFVRRSACAPGASSKRASCDGPCLTGVGGRLAPG